MPNLKYLFWPSNALTVGEIDRKKPSRTTGLVSRVRRLTGSNNRPSNTAAGISRIVTVLAGKSRNGRQNKIEKGSDAKHLAISWTLPKQIERRPARKPVKPGPSDRSQHL
jgi:hypothetical protein